ncbi:leucine rich repeat (LRR) protein [Orenia metallireducens]|uniref:Leucine Rich repeat-containing protein n=1 Tax=Orenia metallireducens TaxID=1413210 RepID=A0A285GVV2_9FIRM|nr:leucine-rich repeat domain-containing protein [Orenia metallireducens]PRX31129.1 leucine rich repeat (LRR) protein [Orenia metallireducens]SNY27424.1 Leucine Rich repeat-containing protein [Orenia metallireducens]
MKHTINNNNKFRNPLSITMDSNKELTVVFSNEFTVSATANRAGIIKVKGGEILFSTEVEKEGRFSYGKEITLIATPPADYGIAYWEVNGQRFNDSDNMNLDQTEISIKIDGNKDVKVIFSPNVYEGDYDQDEGTIWGAIREEINKKKGPITEANLKELLYINATGYDISDLSESSELTGEKYTSYLINLETLILDGSEIGDHPVDADMLETISEINSLRQLEISDIIVNDNGDDDYTSDDLGYDHTDFAVIDAFSKFDKLNNLEVLKLNHNGITDINFIQNLTKLKSLWLLNNRLKDITPLENLKDNLEEVYLTGNKYIRIGTDELPSSGDEHLDDLMIENYHVLNKLSSVYTEEWPEVIVDIEGDGKLNISPTNNENYFFPGRDIFIIPTPLARVGEGDVLTGLSIDGNPIKIQETDNTVDDNSVQALLNSEGRVIKGAIISDDDIIYATYYTNPDNGQTHNIIGKIVVIDCKSDIDISATFEE